MKEYKTLNGRTTQASSEAIGQANVSDQELNEYTRKGWKIYQIFDNGKRIMLERDYSPPVQ